MRRVYERLARSKILLAFVENAKPTTKKIGFRLMKRWTFCPTLESTDSNGCGLTTGTSSPCITQCIFMHSPLFRVSPVSCLLSHLVFDDGCVCFMESRILGRYILKNARCPVSNSGDYLVFEPRYVLPKPSCWWSLWGAPWHCELDPHLAGVDGKPLTAFQSCITP